MPYVGRDDQGNITKVSLLSDALCKEALNQDDAELKAFIEEIGGDEVGDETDQHYRFAKSDLDFVRVMEDLITVLIDKNVIAFTDLPDAAQQKINRRRNYRASLNQQSGLLDDDFLI